MRSAQQLPSANQVLAAVPRKAYQAMLPGLEPVHLVYGQVLYEPPRDASTMSISRSTAWSRC